MTDYIRAYTLPISSLSRIMKSSSQSKEVEIFNCLIRGKKINPLLEQEILNRIKRSIKDNIFYVNKFDLYLFSECPIATEVRRDEFFVLPDDHEIKGLFVQKKWIPSYHQYFKVPAFAYSLFYKWHAEFTIENALFSLLSEVLRKKSIQEQIFLNSAEQNYFTSEANLVIDDRLALLKDLTNENAKDLNKQFKEIIIEQLNSEIWFEHDFNDSENSFIRTIKELFLLIEHMVRFNENGVCHDV